MKKLIFISCLIIIASMSVLIVSASYIGHNMDVPKYCGNNTEGHFSDMHDKFPKHNDHDYTSSIEVQGNSINSIITHILD